MKVPKKRMKGSSFILRAMSWWDVLSRQEAKTQISGKLDSFLWWVAKLITRNLSTSMFLLGCFIEQRLRTNYFLGLDVLIEIDPRVVETGGGVANRIGKNCWK